MKEILKPSPDEYPPYSSIYFDLINEDERCILTRFWDNFLEIKAFVYNLPDETLFYRYAPKKWTIKEILVHLIDDERIFSYRALRYARNDETPLHGFNQDDYSRYSMANERNLDSIFEEYECVRKSTLTLFRHLPEESMLRSGSGLTEDGIVTNRRTVRAILYHLFGHELRHYHIIKERYVL